MFISQKNLIFNPHPLPKQTLVKKIIIPFISDIQAINIWQSKPRHKIRVDLYYFWAQNTSKTPYFKILPDRSHVFEKSTIQKSLL